MRGTLYVGTSGFAYPEWKPDFYPPGTRADGMLAYYAARLPSVEINYTFYREPSAKTVAKWVERTPPGFAFALKANRKITHERRLVEVDDVLERFLETAARLGTRLGPVLFQCPPSLKYDPDVLDTFLARLPGGDMPNACRCAMEFRHPSWETAEVRERLAANGVAWCAADTDDRDSGIVRTAKAFVYVRLRKIDYTDAALETWAWEIRRLIEAGADAYVYFKHEDTASGVLRALRMAELVGSGR